MFLRRITGSRLVVPTALVFLLLGLAACGSSTSATTSSTSAGAAATAAASSASTPTTAATPTTAMASPAANAASPAAGGTTIMVATDATLGKILTNANGMTLYVFAKDTAGTSACNAGCAANWPPLTATGTPTVSSGVTGTVSVITRADGSSQVAYNGKPLYTYIKDTAPGQTTGQGVGGVWSVATP